MKKILYTLSLCAAFVMMTACPKVEPEPTPEPRPEVNASLGQTSLVTSEGMLSDGARKLMVEQADGSYAFVFKESPFSVSYDFIKDYDPTHPFKRYVNSPIDYDFNLGNKPAQPADAGDVIDLTKIMPAVVNLGSRSKGTSLYLSGLPEDLIALEAVNLSEDSRFEVTLKLTDPFFTEGTATPEFKVDMRRFFNSPEAQDGFLDFDAPLTPQNGYKATKVFHISDVPFNPANFSAKNHNLKLEASIGLSGKVYYKDIKTTKARLAAAPSAMLLNVSVVLRNVSINDIKGRVSGVDKKTASQTLKIQSDLAAMELDPATSTVKIDITTSLTLPTETTLDLTSHKGSNTIGSVTGINVPLEVMPSDSSANFSMMLNETSDLSKVLSAMPDDFVFQATVCPPTEENYWFSLGQQTSVSFQPTVTIPYKPGKGFLYEKVDDFTVPSAVGLALKDRSAELRGELVNTMPLDVELIVTLVDGSGNAITQPVSQTFPAGSTTPVSQTIKAPGEAAASIAKAVVTTRVHGTSQSRSLTPNDKFQATLNIHIPGDK